MQRVLKRLRLLWVFLAIPGLMASCNFRGLQTTPGVSTEALFTRAAQTVIAELTLAAPPATRTSAPLPATDTPAATELPTATETPEPESTATVVETAAETATVEVTTGLTPTVTEETAEVLFEEDFERGTGWHTNQNEDFGFEFVDGGYRIYVNIINAPVWSIRGTDETDLRLEVDASRTAGPDTGYFGLVCHHQDGDNYDALVISSDGTYGIAKNEDGEFQFLEEGTAQPGVIRGGEEVNRVRADCVGETLAIYANGQKLAEIQDDDFSGGDVGLIAGTRGEPGLEVLFDNFAILRP